MAIFAAGMIQPCRNRRAHQRVAPVLPAPAAPHIVNQHLSDKGQALRTWVPALCHDDRGYPPLLPFFALALQICPLRCCSDCHVGVIGQGMPCSVLILLAAQPCCQHIPCCHVHCFLICSRSRVRIYLRIKNYLAVLVVCHPQHCCLSPFHVIRGRLDKRLQLPVVEPEELRSCTPAGFACSFEAVFYGI